MSITKSRGRVLFELVFTAILIAFIILFTFFGYIDYGIINITFVHIPVIIGAILLGKKAGLILGFTFGLGSMIRSFVVGVNFPFTNPLLSVLPRMFFGYAAAVIYDFFKTKFKKPVVSVSLTMALSTIIHTFTVVPILYVVAKTKFHFYSEQFDFNNILTFLWILIINNMIWEALVAVFIGTPIVLGLNIEIAKHYNKT